MRHEAIDLVTRIENIVKNPGTSNRTVRVIVRTLEELINQLNKEDAK